MAFQRDYMLNEARKFALLLAKLSSLKAEGQVDEYSDAFNNILKEEYSLELAKLVDLSEDHLKQLLKEQDYSPEKLNALGQMLYVFAEPFKNNEATTLLLSKVLLIFDCLETKHHYQSLDNITKQRHIYQFFKDNYE
ncbi:hypothetical protein ACFQZX_18970 [Mucilaginibacter litoreus]|uniref:Uncharacterized protein n=1 Tax=Mucilaginibacter litoreus TaxID=1048221 RepID=A0ABW3AYT2_9SPHI